MKDEKGVYEDQTLKKGVRVGAGAEGASETFGV